MDTTFTFIGIPFEPRLDIGHFLTFITLLAGFGWWTYSTVRNWRQRAEEEARSGALRLLLYLLREQRGEPIHLDVLFDQFNAPELAARRKAYCKRNWRFESKEQFEAAIYRLDFEGKIDFVGPHEVAFSLDRYDSRERHLQPSNADRNQLLAVLRSDIADPDVSTWDISRIAKELARLAPDETYQILSGALNGTDPEVRRRAAAIMSELVSTPQSTKVSVGAMPIVAMDPQAETATAMERQAD